MRPAVLAALLSCLLVGVTAGSVVGADPDRVTLVCAKVIKIDTSSPKMSVATLEVVRVYVGDSLALGATFQDAHLDMDYNGLSARSPFLTLGEEGLWSISKAGDKYVLTKDPNLPCPVRCRDVKGKDGFRYKEMVELAEAVEKVEKEKPEKRLGLLRELIADTTYELAYWAMTAISRSDTADAKRLLDQLANKPDPSFGIGAQIALDQQLCKKQENDWQDSKPRSEMLRTWVSGKKDQHDAGRILSRLYNAHQDHNLADKLAVELWRTAAENKEWPLDTRKYAIWRMDFVVKFSANDEARFAAIDWVYEQMRSNDTIELRRAAADTLSQLPLYPKRLKAIEEHLATEKDERVAEALRAAIKKARENDK